MRADLILAGGRVYPLGRYGLKTVTHLAVGAGHVLGAGGPELMGLADGETRTVDLGGAAVLPGFNDAHAHVVYAGLTSFGAVLDGARTLREVERRVRRAAARLETGEWLHGRGVSALELREGRLPSRAELDGWAGGRPCFVDDRGGHLRVASSAALAAAGIGPGTADPPGGRIGRTVAGDPDGSLYEAAMRLVADRQPPPTLERRMQGIVRVQRLLLSRGITSVGAAVNRGHADDLRAYQRLLDEGRLRVRVNQFLSWELLAAASSMGMGSGFGGDMLRLGPLKIFVDGGASTGTVALRGAAAPWRTPPEELTGLVRQAQSAGLQVACHAIGDAAVEAVLDAVEAAGPDAVRARHRIEHCTVCPADLRERAARLGVVAVMQPNFLLRRDMAVRVFGEDLARDVAAHRALLRAGVPLAFSSDLPVSPDPDPWLAMSAAVLDPFHSLTPLQALRAYTRGGAFASWEERFKGTLEPGRAADLQVFDQDPLANPPEEWPGSRPSQVLVAGRPAIR